MHLYLENCKFKLYKVYLTLDLASSSRIMQCFQDENKTSMRRWCKQSLDEEDKKWQPYKQITFDFKYEPFIVVSSVSQNHQMKCILSSNENKPLSLIHNTIINHRIQNEKVQEK